MRAEEIADVAEALQCRPQESVIQLARVIAEYCAELARDAPDDGSAAIRQAFNLADPAAKVPSADARAPLRQA